jgi:hypothetical protein
MFSSIIQIKSSLRNISPQILILVANIFIISISMALLSACGVSSSPNTTNTPRIQASASPKVLATALTAELIGKLSIVDECVRVNTTDVSFLLMWPPDITATIERNSIQITTGIVTGNHKVIVLHDGEDVRLSGGETSQPGSNNPSKCPGPYWIVGFEIGAN